MKRLTRDKAIELLKKTHSGGKKEELMSSNRFLEISNSISPMHKEIFYRKYYCGHSESEIADALDLNESVVKTKIREAVRAFRGQL